MIRYIVFSIFFAATVFSSIYWYPDLAENDDNVNLADLVVFTENWQQGRSF
jgi:hypothetical protein